MRILVIENDLLVGSYIAQALQQEHYIVDVLLDPQIGMHKALSGIYNCIIIDTSIFEDNILHVGQKIRGVLENTPLLFLLPDNDIDLKNRLFQIGVDDCMVKPFSIIELSARMKRLIIQYSMEKNFNRIFEFADLKVDANTRKVYRETKQIHLRNKEFMLLEYMVQYPYKVLPRALLLQHVWDNFTDLMTNTVDAHMSSLRKKLALPEKKELIHTVYGVGYKLSDVD